jgi:hypothetical protein
VIRLSLQSGSLLPKIFGTGCFRSGFWPVACAISLCHGFAAFMSLLRHELSVCLSAVNRPLGTGARDVGDNSRVSASSSIVVKTIGEVSREQIAFTVTSEV